jgi:hypothetical protein
LKKEKKEMKKITGAFALILAGAVLFMAGCPSPTIPDPKEAVNNLLTEEGVTVGGNQHLNITGVSASGMINNIIGTEFTLTFTEANSNGFSLDKAALQAALEIHELAVIPALGGGVTATSLNSLVPNAVSGSNRLAEVGVLYVNGSSARIKADLQGVTTAAIRIRVKASDFTANGGRLRLNADGDLTPGEAEDDLYASAPVTAVATTTLTPVGTVILPNPLEAITVSSSFGASGGTLLNEFNITVNQYADSEDYTAFLNSNLKIDKYQNGAWSLGAATFTLTAAVGTGGSLPNVSRVYTASFTSADGDILRARIEGIRNFETTNNYYGSKQKFASTYNAGGKAGNGADQTILAITSSIDTSGAGYTVNSIASSNATVVADGASGNVYVRIPLDTALDVVGIAGLTNVTQDTIKIVTTVSGTTPVNLEWESSSYTYGWGQNSNADDVYIPTALLLKLPSSYTRGSISSWAVYVTPAVTAGSRKALPNTTVFLPGIFTGIADQISGSGDL